jgi:hypothetical protein
VTRLSRLPDTLAGDVPQCAICGDAVRFGGFWLGEGSDLTLCTSTSCNEKVLHLVIDALNDRHWSRCQRQDAATEWRNWTSRVFWEKAANDRVDGHYDPPL